MMLSLLFSFLEQWSIAILKADPTLQCLLRGLQGKTVCMEITDYPTFYLHFMPHSIHVETGDAQTPLPRHLTFRGTLPEVLKGLHNLQNHGSLMGAALEIEGDLGTAQLLQGILSEFVFDWPLWISPLVGDSIANRMEYHIEQTRSYWLGPLKQVRKWAYEHLTKGQAETGNASGSSFSFFEPFLGSSFSTHLKELRERLATYTTRCS